MTSPYENSQVVLGKIYLEWVEEVQQFKVMAADLSYKKVVFDWWHSVQIEKKISPEGGVLFQIKADFLEDFPRAEYFTCTELELNKIPLSLQGTFAKNNADNSVTLIFFWVFSDRLRLDIPEVVQVPYGKI